MRSLSIFLVTLPLFLIDFTSSQVHDLTIVPYSKGKDVVSAVLKKIQRSEVFPSSDNDFLRRVAFYETKFGTLNHTYEPSDNLGGIWQIDEAKFNLTQSLTNPNLTEYYTRINSTFGIAWLNLTIWRDLLKPLYSALAARLWLSTLPEPIPQTIQHQAAFWKKYYNLTGDTEKFIQEVREYENKTECRGLMDLAVVLDGSGSITPTDFMIGKGFVLSLVASFSLENVRSGFIVYSDESEVIFPLEHNETYDGLRDLILNATHPMALTETDDAILTAVEMMNNVTYFREGVPRILTVFTDGLSTNGVATGPAAALNDSIISFAIGIGDEISHDELVLIANNDSSRVYEIQSYDALTEFFFKLNTLTCEVPQQPGLNETTNDTLVEEEKRYYQFEIPIEGLTITIQVSEGGVVGYYSYTEDTPSSALYDGLIDAASVFIPWRNLTSKRVGEKAGEGQAVFITMEGNAPKNDYSLEAGNGDLVQLTDPPTESTTVTVTEASSPVTDPSSTVTDVSSASSTDASTETLPPSAGSTIFLKKEMLLILLSISVFLNW